MRVYIVENEKKSIVIYGLGTNFTKLFTKRVKDRLKREFFVVGFVDKKKEFEEKICKEFACYQKIPYVQIDYVCITSTLYYSEIKEELLAQSIDEVKILPKNYWLDFYQSTYLPTDVISGKGVEIGGPSAVFQAIYHSGCVCDGVNYSEETIWNGNLDSVYKWEEQVLGNQIVADATDLKIIADETYDFVLSSNNLEHIANPLQAVKEFLRVLKKGKPLVILVPCKKYTFDHKRDDTTFEHLLEDYRKGVLEDDLSHLDEILELHDLSLDKLAGTKEQFRERSKNNFKNRCLHHHVFSNELLACIGDYFNLEILENTVFDQNYYLLGIKRE